MAAALLTATGSTQGLLDTNPGMRLSALFHMHAMGLQGIWSYGDAGPNKYTATANGIMFYGQQYSACSCLLPVDKALISDDRHSGIRLVPA